jgi:hypothetical protein
VREGIELGADRRDDLRVAVSEVHRPDAAGKIDVLVPVDIPEARALGADREEGKSASDAASDGCRAAAAQLVGSRTGHMHDANSNRVPASSGVLQD